MHPGGKRRRCYRIFRILWLSTPPLQGPDVRALQMALTMRGFYTGPVNGIYDRRTAQAVASFRSHMHMLPGTAAPSSLQQALCVRCYLDCDQKTIMCTHGRFISPRPGDTLFTIARRYGLVPQAVIAVNQHITNPDEIPAGTMVCLPPFRLRSIPSPDMRRGM